MIRSPDSRDLARRFEGGVAAEGREDALAFGAARMEAVRRESTSEQRGAGFGGFGARKAFLGGGCWRAAEGDDSGHDRGSYAGGVWQDAGAVGLGCVGGSERVDHWKG